MSLYLLLGEYLFSDRQSDGTKDNNLSHVVDESRGIDTMATSSYGHIDPPQLICCDYKASAFSGRQSANDNSLSHDGESCSLKLWLRSRFRTYIEPKKCGNFLRLLFL